MKSISFLSFSDINFDQLGTELLQQQPLLSSTPSSQIIPDLTDNNVSVARQFIKSEPITSPPSQQQQNVYKVVQSNASKPVSVKTTTASHVSAPQKVQIVKKIPANAVSNVTTANSPIVINKVNGNISGK